MVEGFLRKHPISSWILLDKTGTVLKRYGVEIRPTTVVIDPKGRIAAVTTPDKLERTQLLQLSGLSQALGQISLGAASAAIKTVSTARGESDSQKGSGGPRGVTVSPSKPGEQPHTMFNGVGDFTMNAASVPYMLHFGLQVPERRVQASEMARQRLFDFQVREPGSSIDQPVAPIQKQLRTVGVRLAAHTSIELAETLVPTSRGVAKPCSEQSSKPGFAFYDPNAHQLKLMRATPAQIAAALEDALGTPVLPGFASSCLQTSELQLPSGGLSAENLNLQGIGLQLKSGRRPVTTYSVTVDARKSSSHE